MDAAEYLKKAALICDIYDNKSECGECPLTDVKCGLPIEPEDQTKAIEIVSNFVVPPERYICPQCKNEDHSADAKFCKICGLKIN